jgi:hypothetical protein
VGEAIAEILAFGIGAALSPSAVMRRFCSSSGRVDGLARRARS